MTLDLEVTAPAEESTLRLATSALRRGCDPTRLGFRTTAELPGVAEIPGQGRAVDAIQFGLGIRREGFNVFVLGPAGAGKKSLIERFTRTQAQGEPTPADWAYVHNFSEPQRPKALCLPPGRGPKLKQDMVKLVEELRVSLPATFESDEYRTKRQVIDEAFKKQQQEAFDALGKKAQARGIALLRTPLGVGLAPIRDGEVLSPEEFDRLPDEEQERTRKAMEALQAEIDETLRKAPQWESERQEKVRELNREVTRFAIGHLLSNFRAGYTDLPSVLEHLDVVERDLVDSAGQFLHTVAESASPIEGTIRKLIGDSASFDRYQINLLVPHEERAGAPIVEEDHPTVQNLVGRVEHRAQLGHLLTDFTLIRPGALHRANGGYLVLDARRVLQQPYAWDELKRAIRSKEIQIRSVGEMLGLVSTISVQPEPIPLDVKIILTGDRVLYYLLTLYDPDFLEMFKVAADFEDDMDRSEEGERAYARLVAALAQREGLRPLDAAAVARVIEHASRLSGDAQKVSAQIETIADLLREADYWAARENRAATTVSDVQRAIDAQIHRANRIKEQLQEAVRRGARLIDTAGSRVGQVNGLSVYALGGHMFGHPSRITARTRLGKGEVVDIEREVELGGPIHSKGVLILAGYLGSQYAREKPLSLSASLVFEQSYGGVEGDSASLAELCALLSALGETPVRQGFAITGSVNQNGQAQAIGGVNEKIEGFFDVCRDAGLTGSQGVVIPRANVQHLMLRHDVVDAVTQGRFHVYAVDTVDQAMALLTGLAAGERDGSGRFPGGSVNARVEAALTTYAERARAFAAPQPREPSP